MKKSITILSFIFAFFLFTTNVEASFPVKKNKENTEASASNSLEKNATDAAAPMSMASGKSQIVAAVLCFVVGWLGIHRFYLGYIWQGVVQLLTLGGFGIWALIDLIRIILGDLGPKNGSYSQTF